MMQPQTVEKLGLPQVIQKDMYEKAVSGIPLER